MFEYNIGGQMWSKKKRVENTGYYYRSEKNYDFARKSDRITLCVPSTEAQEKMPFTTSYFSSKSL